MLQNEGKRTESVQIRAITLHLRRFAEAYANQKENTNFATTQKL